MDELLLEEFKFDNLDFEKQNKVYDIFKQSYEKATGTSWDKSKFRSRAENWLFFGDQDGFVTVRPQRGGYYKLTGVAGGIKSILKGLTELQTMNVPVWGMMTPELSNILVNRYGYKKPSGLEAKIIIKSIPPSAFGNVDYKMNKDGSVTFSYADVGEATKVFVANKQYYSNVRKMLLTMAKDKLLSPFKKKKVDEEVLDEKRAVDLPHKTGLDVMFEFINKYGWDNTYISFRDDVRVTEKNPNNTYNTPTGIYCYPVISYKDKVENAKSMGDFVKNFPYQYSKQYMHVFSIRDYSNVLFTGKDETPRLNKYVERIKQIYDTKYPEISHLCDLFIAGNYVGSFEGNKFKNVTHNFWLLLYDVENKATGNRNLNHKVTILCNKIGVDGFVDDACSGSIHSAEPCQAVFFRLRPIELGFIVIDAHADRSDIPVKIIKGKKYDNAENQEDKEENESEKFDKYKKFLSGKLKINIYEIDPQYKAQIKNKTAFWVRDENDNYLFINAEGNASIKGLNIDKIPESDKGNKIRAAYFNSLTNRRDFHSVPVFGGVTGNPDRGIAIMANPKGTRTIIINREGKPDLKGINAKKSTDPNRLLAFYYNQRLKLPIDKMFLSVTPFGYLTGDKKHAVAVYPNNITAIINTKGQKDVTEMNPLKIEYGKALAAYYNQKYGVDEYNEVQPFNPSLFDGKHTMAMYRNKSAEIVDVDGKPDISSINPENTTNSTILTVYFNQKMGRKFARVLPFNQHVHHSQYTIAYPYDDDSTSMVINIKGEYDVAGIKPNDIESDSLRSAYFNTLSGGVRMFEWVKEFGEGTNNPNRAYAEKTNGEKIIIDEKGEENYEDIDITKLTGDLSKIRAALYNKKLGNKAYLDVFDFGTYVNEPNHALAVDPYDKYKIINKEGIPDISDVDPRTIDDNDILTTYYEQKLGEKKFRKVNEFGYNTGDKNHATATKVNGDQVIIDINGNEDYDGVDVTQVSDVFRKSMINNMLGGDVYSNVATFNSSYAEDPRAVATKIDGEKVIINAKGVPDMSGIDPRKIRNDFFLTTYMNQKLGKEKYEYILFFPEDSDVTVALLSPDRTPVYINIEGVAVKMTDFDKVNKENSTQLAAYFNGLIGNNKYKKVLPFGTEINSTEYTIAYDKNDKPIFIDKTGEAVEGGIDPNTIYDEGERANYFNQLIGEEKYDRVSEFGNHITGNPNIGIGFEENGTATYINKQGKPDISEVNPQKIENRRYLAAYFNTLFADLNPYGSPFSTVYPFGEYTGNKNLALASLKNNKQIIINVNGEKDITDINVDAILQVNDEVRAAYLNQLLGEDIYLDVNRFGKLEGNPDIAYAHLKNGGSDFINKEGKPDISGLDFNKISSDYLHVIFNHKVGKNIFAKVYSAGTHLGIGDKEHHLAQMVTPPDEGFRYKIINSEGVPDIANIDPMKITSETVRSAYYNQLLDNDYFKNVYEFHNGEASAYTRNGFNVTINTKGQIKNNDTGEFEDLADILKKKKPKEEKETTDESLNKMISEILASY